MHWSFPCIGGSVHLRLGAFWNKYDSLRVNTVCPRISPLGPHVVFGFLHGSLCEGGLKSSADKLRFDAANTAIGCFVKDMYSHQQISEDQTSRTKSRPRT